MAISRGQLVKELEPGLNALFSDRDWETTKLTFAEPAVL